MMIERSLSRRDVLKSAAALGLWFAVPGLEGRAAERRGPERAKSLLTIWLQGGASQLETWDPHPGKTIGGPTQAIETKISEAKICNWFPQLAEEIHRLSIIRSLVSKEGDHERASYVVRTGYRPDPTLIHPSLGAITAHELPDPSIEIPMFVSIGEGEFPSRGGFLGDQFDPYRIFQAGENGQNLVPYVSAERQQRRLAGLSVVSQSFRRGRSRRVDQSLHQHTVDAALRMMTSEQLKAFSVDEESKTTKEAYGDTPFGRGCLVARRLLETGVRAIEVTQNGFDTHGDNFEGHRLRAGIMDPALATLLKELDARDLLQSTVVLVIGEFGRTPKINPLDGRDHWPTGFSCLVGGGGLASGQLIGSTDEDGVKTMPDEPQTVADLYATILKTLGVDYTRELLTPIGRPMKLCEGTPIERLLA